MQKLFLLIFMLICTVAPQAFAGKPTFIEGKHYSLLSQRLPHGVAPVVEFFYYGCETCYQIAPLVGEWVSKNNIQLALIPTHSETVMVDEARFHHTFQLMGVLGKMYMDTYEMIQLPNSLQGKERIDFYLDKNKIDKNLFWKVWDSEQVAKRLEGSASLSKLAQISKTPTFIVYGLYKVDIEKLTEINQLFDLLDFLLEKKPSTAPALLLKK